MKLISQFSFLSYFQFNSKEDKYEAFIVPRSRSSRAIDDEREDYFENARSQVSEGKGCLITDEFIETGESLDVPELCIQLVCKENSNVDVRSLQESRCRRRRNRN